jgi:hypothetical protein
VESSEHEVDYDEAFVKVVERHRREFGDRTDDSQGRDSGEDLA